jgi:hypothetical protein
MQAVLLRQRPFARQKSEKISEEVAPLSLLLEFDSDERTCSFMKHLFSSTVPLNAMAFLLPRPTLSFQYWRSVPATWGFTCV